MCKYLYIVIAAILLISCQEVFIPDVEEVEPFLIIEGSISTQPESHEVSINWSSEFQHNPIFQSVNNAYVYVEDELGNRVDFHNTSNGRYQTDEATPFAAVVGRSYFLRVEMDDGNVYQSEPQTVVDCPEVKTLNCSFATNALLHEDAYGDAIEITYDGFNIFTGTEGILPYNNFYFYKYIAYEQHKTVIQIGVQQYYLYEHRRLSSKYLNFLLIGNADEFGNYVLRDKKLLFVGKDDMTRYTPPLPDTITVLSTRFEGLLFELEQHSLSPDAYSFWHDAETQLEAKGRLFDPVSPQLHGNMHCVNDSLNKVIGIFSASNVSEKVAYLYIDYQNRTYSKDLDSMPELVLGGLQWSRPEGWIDPPF